MKANAITQGENVHCLQMDTFNMLCCGLQVKFDVSLYPFSLSLFLLKAGFSMWALYPIPPTLFKALAHHLFA